jgi:hypothetical protein
MGVGLYFDVHVDHAITVQLRRRHVDILTAQEDGAAQWTDEAILSRTAELSRPIVTHDIRFLALAESWLLHSRPFGGLIYGHPMRVSIGRFVIDLELIAKATDPSDWTNVTLRLPL